MTPAARARSSALAAYALEIRRYARELAMDIAEMAPIPFFTARTLIEHVAKGIETDDVDFVAYWMALVRRRYDVDTLNAVIVLLESALQRKMPADHGDRAVVSEYLTLALARAKTRTRSTLSPDILRDPQAAGDVLLELLREHDETTALHVEATARLSRRLCTALGITETQTERIALAALLHDVGKIATPHHVLRKTSGLTPFEWDIMRAHPAEGARMLAAIPALADLAPIVRAHHERIDGAGYPFGLVSREIPFESRVIAVADAFDAMTTVRPYARPRSFGDAMTILHEGRGVQWDEAVVDVMISLATTARNESREADLNRLAAPAAEPARDASEVRTG